MAKGQVLRSVIKLTISEGWHTYWKNPGEGGIPIKMDASLPDGWSLGSIQYPEPIRFKTGPLASYGYEGEVLLPVTITLPTPLEESLPEIKATLSWLTCNESSCVPGKAELKLQAVSDSSVIEAAYQAVPKPLPGAKISFKSRDEQIEITLTLPPDRKFDPAEYEIFPATPDIIAAESKILFKPLKNSQNTWIANVRASEYLSDQPKPLKIELFKSGMSAWIVTSSN